MGNLEKQYQRRAEQRDGHTGLVRGDESTEKKLELAVSQARETKKYIEHEADLLEKLLARGIKPGKRLVIQDGANQPKREITIVSIVELPENKRKFFIKMSGKKPQLFGVQRLYDGYNRVKN